MELVKQFNSELSSLYEAKPPISKAKMTSITRTAIKAIKLYKHVVQSVEKFIQKCKPEYKVPGLYVIDSIVRQSRHQFGTEKDVFAPRFARNLQQTFVHLFNCPPEDKSKVIRVLNLWQKNNVFESEVIQPLFDLADPNHPVHKEQAALAPSNGIAPVKPPTSNTTPKNASSKKEGGTAGWINQLNSDTHSTSAPQKTHQASSQAVDVNLIQQLQQLQTLLLDQQADSKTKSADSDQIKFDKKLLDFDYGEEEDEDGPPQHHQQQQQVVAGLDSLGSILSNPEVLRQLQTLQQTLSNPQHLRQQQMEMEEKMRKMQEMRQQEEEFDKHLAQTVPNLPFADQCELKPGDLSGFPGMDMSQPPPGYPAQQKLMVPPGMMMKPPSSPLEDGEHASSDADERVGRRGQDEGGPSVVVLDSDSPSESPTHGRRRRRRSRSRSRSHHRRSRSDSRSRSRSKRKRRSTSYDDKDWERAKQREAEKEKERERKRKGLPPLKKNYLAVCSTTLWIGHLSKLVQQEELSDTFGEFGDIVSIDLIPPRGCAFICMNRRQDAHRALQDLRHHKLQGKAITLAWAPGKGMKGKEYKDYWEVEQGVSYIPWSKLMQDIDVELLEEGGMIDEESMPDWLKERQKKNKDDDHHRSQSSSQAEDDESKGNDLDIPVPAPTLPGYIPLPDGPQPTDRPPVSQPPPTLPPLMGPAPPLGMMPPFAVPREYTGLLGPMGMAMGPGLMPNVPLGVPPPGMQGLMGNPLMHQQMMSRMPQPVGSPFNPPPGVGLLGPQLSQIPLPGQDKGKGGMNPLGVPPPNDGSSMPPFTDAMMQLPFTLPPQLQLPGMGMLARGPVADGKPGEGDGDNRDNSSPPKSSAGPMQPPFGQPPPQFSPMSLMKIPPPMSVPPPNKGDKLGGSDDKDDREKDKDYRDTPKDYKDRDKDRDRDRDYRNRRDRDYRGDRDYRDRFDKDYRDREKDYRDKDRDRKDRRSRERDDKNEQDLREKDGKPDEKGKDEAKDDKGYRDRSDRDRSRNRDRERDRGRDRKWGDRDRERGRDRERDDRRGRDRERDRSKEMKGADREKVGPNIQDRLRNMAHEQDRGEFPRGGMEANNFQGPPGGPNFGPRSEGFHPEGYPPDMHGRHPTGRRDVFDHRGPPPDGFDPRGPPPEGFGPRGLPMDNFGPRGPPPDGFGPRGPPPSGFGPDSFNPRGPPPDFDGQGPPPDNFNMRGPPPENFNRGPLIPDNFGPGGPPPDNFLRGPPSDEFGPHGPPFEGFGGPHGPPGEFQPRIRFELFSRGRGRGQESFRGRGARGGGPAMFSPRGAGPRGPRAGPWMESQGPSPPKPGFGFPPRGFAPTEGGPERFGPPMFEESGRGRGSPGNRGRGRGFQGRGEDRRWEEEEGTSLNPKRLSRWSNPSPPPFIPPSEEARVESESAMDTSATEPVAMDVSESQQEAATASDVEKNLDNLFCSESSMTQGDRSVGEILVQTNRGSELSEIIDQPSTQTAVESINQPAAERNFPFGGVSEDSTSMQMPTNKLETEREEISSVFQQDSQSIPDVEMSNSHYSFNESGQQSQPEDSLTSEDPERRQSFQQEDCQGAENPKTKESTQPEVCQLSDDPNRRFADIGFPEKVSHSEDNANTSLQDACNASMAEIEERLRSHTSQLQNEIHQNIDFSMGDSVSSAVEQSVFETHSATGPEYDPNESSQSIHFEQRQNDVFSEISQPHSQQAFSIEELQENFSSFEEQKKENEPNLNEGSEPVHQQLPLESCFESSNSEVPAPDTQKQTCESGDVGGEILSGEVSSQDQNSLVEDSEH